MDRRTSGTGKKKSISVRTPNIREERVCMDLILAVDLKGGVVVHGRSGARETYRPLGWGLAPSAEPEAYLEALGPRRVYFADLDRIAGYGDHLPLVRRLAPRFEACYVDAGWRSVAECSTSTGFVPVLGTETIGDALGDCPRGVLSVDCRDGVVVPGGEDPVAFLESVRSFSFAAHLVLDIGGVGTRRGLDPPLLALLRSASDRPLLWGGGVGTTDDLDLLERTGFDGAIVATAVHSGAIPLDAVRRGRWS
jgi:phosphoribosylformimino-5-aminoimidazole carboxamide ribotide isomerase